MATPRPDPEVPVLIMVDDTDSSIQYSPLAEFRRDLMGVLQQNGQGGPVYNSSITGTSSNGSFSFQFNGTFVRISLAVELVGKATNWKCAVDNQTMPSFQIDDTQITNFLACDSGNMLTGTTDEHTLVVDLWFGQTGGNVSMIWLDSIQYQPLPSDSLDGVSIRVHNSDPSVTYNGAGAWKAAEAAGLPAVPGDTGTNVTFVDGALASLVNFTFSGGESVTLFGVFFANFNDNTATFNTGTFPVSFYLPGITSNISNSSISNYPLFSTFLVPNIEPFSDQYNLGIATNENVTLNPEPLSISYFVIQNSTTNPTLINTTPTSSGLSKAASVTIIVFGIITFLAIVVFFRRQQLKRWKKEWQKQQQKILDGKAAAAAPTDGTLPDAENGVVGTAEVGTFFSQARDFVITGGHFTSVGGNMIEMHQPTIIMSPEHISNDLDKVIEPVVTIVQE